MGKQTTVFIDKFDGLWGNSLNERDVRATYSAIVCDNLINFKGCLISRPNCIRQNTNIPPSNEASYVSAIIPLFNKDQNIPMNIIVTRTLTGAGTVYLMKKYGSSWTYPVVPVYLSKDSTVAHPNGIRSTVHTKPVWFYNDVDQTVIILDVYGEIFEVAFTTDALGVKIYARTFTVSDINKENPVEVTHARTGAKILGGIVLAGLEWSPKSTTNPNSPISSIMYYREQKKDLVPNYYVDWGVISIPMSVVSSQMNFFVVGARELTLFQHDSNYELGFTPQSMTKSISPQFNHSLPSIDVYGLAYDGTGIQFVMQSSREKTVMNLPEWDNLNSSYPESSITIVRNLIGQIYPAREGIAFNRVQKVGTTNVDANNKIMFMSNSGTFFSYMSFRTDTVNDLQMYSFASINDGGYTPRAMFGGMSDKVNNQYRVSLYLETDGYTEQIIHRYETVRINPFDKDDKTFVIKSATIDMAIVNYTPNSFDVILSGYNYSTKQMETISLRSFGDVSDNNLPTNGIQAIIDLPVSGFSEWKDFRIGITCMCGFLKIASIRVTVEEGTGA